MTKVAILGHSSLLDLARPSGPVNLGQIATALGHINRFNGNTIRPYSVAEHSIRVSQLVEPRHKLAALLHDAGEAFVGDIVSPIKREITGFDRLEHNVLVWLRSEFNVDLINLPGSVHHADLVMAATELRDMVRYPDLVQGMPAPLEARISTIVQKDVGKLWLYLVEQELKRCKS